MNCDDQVWLVKRDDDPHADALDLTRVARLTCPISIEVDWLLDNTFHIFDGTVQTPEIVLGVSRKAHRPSRAQRLKFTPTG
jgi:hypothetical protein